MITASEAGRRGALITNKKLTTEGRKKAAKKGWRLRKKRIAELQKLRGGPVSFADKL